MRSHLNSNFMAQPYRCSTRSLISCVRPWFQNCVPMYPQVRRATFILSWSSLPHRGQCQTSLPSFSMIWISPSENADFKMRIFNADGSEAKMCGNGIRCLGKYVYDNGLTDKTELTVETLSGLRRLTLHPGSDGRVASVSVKMGMARVEKPLSLALPETSLSCIPVSVGNPHAVTFVKNVSAVPLAVWGPLVEKYPTFHDGVNAEFVEVLSSRCFRMRVWERGSGITLACGTGACASAAAAVAAGYCPAKEEITARLDGGELQIRVYPSGEVVMTGPAVTVYKGEIEL